MPKFYVDSNIFFYAKIMDRVFGESCAKVLRSIISGETKASLSTLIPLEVANALTKYGLTEEVASEIQAIFSMGVEVHPIDAPDVREVAQVFKDSRVSPYDCAHAVIMKKHGIRDIISADADFDKFQWVRRVDPRSFTTAV